jgi:hypothetical protein
MNISRYMKNHETMVNETLLSNTNPTELQKIAAQHEKTTAYMQHERLIHLIVTLAFGAFLLITMAIAFIKPQPLVLVLLGMFFVMLIPYVAHYFFLENTIQRWYQLSDRIEEAIESLKS